MKKTIGTFFLLISFAGVIAVQYAYDSHRTKIKFKEPFVLKPEVIKAVDLSLHNAASDLAWLAAIQYFGGGESKTYKELPSYLTLATELNPKFSYPYAFAALVLPSIEYEDQGIKIAKRGIEEDLSDWKIPYYLASAYHIYKNDPENASKYFDVAANTNGVPEGIKKVAAKYGSRSDKREQTKQIWIGVYENSKDSVVKERAKNYIIHLEILDLMEKASKQYFSLYKEYPKKSEDLVNGKILKEIPPDPFGLTFEIDQTDGTVRAL